MHVAVLTIGLYGAPKMLPAISGKVATLLVRRKSPLCALSMMIDVSYARYETNTRTRKDPKRPALEKPLFACMCIHYVYMHGTMVIINAIKGGHQTGCILTKASQKWKLQEVRWRYLETS